MKKGINCLGMKWCWWLCISVSMVYATSVEAKGVIFTCLYSSQFSHSQIQFFVSLKNTRIHSQVYFFSFCNLQKGRAMFSLGLHKSLLQFSFIIVVLIIGSTINFHGSFFFIRLLYFRLASRSVGFSPKVFSSWLFIWFVFLACERASMTQAIFQLISSFYF